MLNFVLVIDDGGELVTLQYSDLAATPDNATMLSQLDAAINTLLDARAQAAGTYTPGED